MLLPHSTIKFLDVVPNTMINFSHQTEGPKLNQEYDEVHSDQIDEKESNEVSKIAYVQNDNFVSKYTRVLLPQTTVRSNTNSVNRAMKIAKPCLSEPQQLMIAWAGPSNPTSEVLNYKIKITDRVTVSFRKKYEILHHK